MQLLSSVYNASDYDTFLTTALFKRLCPKTLPLKNIKLHTCFELVRIQTLALNYLRENWLSNMTINLEGHYLTQ